MEKRIALIGIIVENSDAVPAIVTLILFVPELLVPVDASDDELE